MSQQRKRTLAERFEDVIPALILILIVVLAVGMVWGIMHSDDASWMRAKPSSAQH